MFVRRYLEIDEVCQTEALLELGGAQQLGYLIHPYRPDTDPKNWITYLKVYHYKSSTIAVTQTQNLKPEHRWSRRTFDIGSNEENNIEEIVKELSEKGVKLSRSTTTATSF